MTEREHVAEPRPTLHVVFSLSAVGIVSQALKRVGCQDALIGLPNNLTYGPIDDIMSSARAAWLEQHTLRDREGSDWETKLWTTALSQAWSPVAWVARGDAGEYASFLEFATRKGAVPFDMVDVPRLCRARADGRGTFVLTRLGLASPEDIIAARMWELRRTPSRDEIDSYRAVWAQLQAENAPLRIIENGALVSAPLDLFDDVIFGWASDDWQVVARVIGETMCSLIERDQWIDNWFLRGRVRALVDAGRLELSGDSEGIFHANVRRVS